MKNGEFMLPMLHFVKVLEIFSEIPSYRVYKKFPLCCIFLPPNHTA